MSRRYQEGDYASRAAIWKMHIDYLRSLHHFMSDRSAGAEGISRPSSAEFGLDRTHHSDTEGWPHQLYVRVVRRMVGRYVAHGG